MDGIERYVKNVDYLKKIESLNRQLAVAKAHCESFGKEAIQFENSRVEILESLRSDILHKYAHEYLDKNEIVLGVFAILDEYLAKYSIDNK